MSKRGKVLKNLKKVMQELHDLQNTFAENQKGLQNLPQEDAAWVTMKALKWARENNILPEDRTTKDNKTQQEKYKSQLADDDLPF